MDTNENYKNPKVYIGRLYWISFRPLGKFTDFTFTIINSDNKEETYQTYGAELTVDGKIVDSNSILRLIIDGDNQWNVEVHTQENSYRPITDIHFTKGQTYE